MKYFNLETPKAGIASAMSNKRQLHAVIVQNSHSIVKRTLE
jgi:hypothetical protein